MGFWVRLGREKWFGQRKKISSWVCDCGFNQGENAWVCDRGFSQRKKRRGVFVMVGLVRGSIEEQMGLAAWVEEREATTWVEGERRK